VALKIGHFGKQIRNTLKVFKYGAGEMEQIIWTYRVIKTRNITWSEG
jgi:hypothetical protein